jgi:hypothetical protein
MQKLQTYFGVRVVLTPDLDPIRLDAVQDRVQIIRQRYDYNVDEYHLYLHTLRIWAEDSHFGVAGGLSQRLKCLGITFSVNPKQQSEKEIKFLNDEAVNRLPPGVTLAAHPYEVTFSLDGRFFDEQQAFNNELIAFVRKTVKPNHRKIRAAVWAEPTPLFAERLRERNLSLRSKFTPFLSRPVSLGAPAVPAQRSAGSGEETARRRSPSKTVFISYSHLDGKWRDRLLVHLKPYERRGLLSPWSDKQIAAGQDWEKEIRKALEAASVAVLLVSADFMASDYIATRELPPILERAQREGVTIIPVILSPSAWTDLEEFRWLQSINANDRPLLGRKKVEQEEVWENVRRRIEAVLGKSPAAGS